MKKLILYSAILIAVMCCNFELKSQPLQDFEAVTFPPALPGAWTLQYSGTQYWTRLAGTSGYTVGTGSAKFDFFNASAGVVQSLISPTLTASISGDSLKFDHAYRTYTTEVDTLYIDVSSNDGATYSNLVTLLGGTVVGTGMVTYAASTSSGPPTLASQWATKTYALPAGTNKIRFRAASAFGNNLFIDNIKTNALSTALANDISTVSINSPSGTVILPSALIAPKATFSNIGTANQSSIPVTYKITGPVNYTSNKVISTLNTATNIQVTFDSTFNPVVGSYNVTVYCSLGSDGNRTNDTLFSSFTVVDPNWGSGTGGIYFANSLAGGAPSKPEVCWADTSGGLTLCKNGIYYDSAVFTGTLDDGYWKLGNLFPSGYSVRLNGVSYDSIFPTTNGILGLTFNSNLNDWSPAVLPDATHGVELFPFFKDFDLRTIAGPDSYIKVLVRGTRLYVYWLARTYNSGGASNDVIFFGACVELSNSAANSNITYTYGDASKGTSTTFISAVNGNTLADHVIGLQSNAALYNAYRQRVTSLTIPGPVFSDLSGSALAVEFGPDASNLNNKCSTLNLSVCLEQCSSSTFKISLYNSSCQLIDLRTVSYTGGTMNMNFAGVDNSPQNYYIRVANKNYLTIWSNSVSFTGNSLSYDFTTGLDKVYGGNNLKNSGSTYCMIAGDPNQDFAIDASDLAEIANDADCGDPGCVSGLPTDITCDDYVDAGDIALVENNQGYYEDAPCLPGDNIIRLITKPTDKYIFIPEEDKTPSEDKKPLR